VSNGGAASANIAGGRLWVRASLSAKPNGSLKTPSPATNSTAEEAKRTHLIGYDSLTSPRFIDRPPWVATAAVASRDGTSSLHITGISPFFASPHDTI
jgi:hypothetical protein